MGLQSMVTERMYKILVVDDEPDLEQLMLQRMRRDIRAGRYEFLFAQNGIEALERLTEHDDVDMVLSDINMPRMDGLTLLEQIPLVDPEIRSVIISAYGDMKNIRTAMNRGAFDFVTKPVDFDDLRVTIDRTLKHMDEWREALSMRDKLVALQNEIDVASKIQQSILPTEFPISADYVISAKMEPARNVGGDFFAIIKLPNDRIGIAVADVSDKGVPAALFMMSSLTLLKGAAIGLGEPGQVLTETNDLLNQSNETAMFVTVLYAVYNPHDGSLTYANGGHNPPIIVKPDGSSTLIPMTGGIVLGVVPDFQFEQNTVVLNPGDTIILYTDGVTEALNENKEEFGLEALRNIFVQSPPKLPEETNAAIFDAVVKFANDTPQSDDITCLILRRSET